MLVVAYVQHSIASLFFHLLYAQSLLLPSYQINIMVRISLLALVLVGSASAFSPAQHAISRPSTTTALQMSTESANKDPVKVGVIGCGRIGIVHLGAINKAPGVQPIVVSNPTVSKAEDGK